MSNIQSTSKKILDFWNNRASLKQAAGSNDLIAKQLEIQAISQYVKDGMRILEVGCGNGITAVELAKQFNVDILGVDFAEEMVAEAAKLAENEEMIGQFRFKVADVLDLSEISDRFDMIYTERVLINLPDWESQTSAIANITNLLVPNGIYVMCENSQDGLDKINELRVKVGLHKIIPPWHNLYFVEDKLKEIIISGVNLESVECYSSTYYFLSRVVNAAVAANEGNDPQYDSFINQLALHLPSISDFGQGKIWLWRKIS